MNIYTLLIKDCSPYNMLLVNLACKKNILIYKTSSLDYTRDRYDAETYAARDRYDAEMYVNQRLVCVFGSNNTLTIII